MEEAILNSLLRYSNQLTPSRETYPIPSKTWTGALRTTAPNINYSTYYLLDDPTLANSPYKPQGRLSSCASTSALSPQKRLSKFSPVKQPGQSVGSSPKKIPEIHDLKRIIEEEQAAKSKTIRNTKPAKTTESPGKIVEEKKQAKVKKSKNINQEFQDYKREQEEKEFKMKEEIEALKEMLKQSNELVKSLQQKG